MMAPTKAPGPDAIGAEIWKCDIPVMARKCFPLVLKTAVRGQWPVEFAGGWQIPLFKGKGSASHMSGYRGILLEPTMGRILSRSWRSRIEEVMQYNTAPMQFGGIKGIGIEGAHLQVRMWQQNTAAMNMCQAMLFADIKGAFYSVSKPFLQDRIPTKENIHELFRALALPQEAFQQFCANLEQGSSLSQVGASPTLARVVSGSLKATWFCIPRGKRIMAPETGSRPGDPLADLLFSFIMRRIILDINDKLIAEGLYEPLVYVEDKEFLHANNTTWVDDVVFTMHGPVEGFLQKTYKMIAIVIDTMCEHGMKLSFGQGKTALLLKFRGRGAPKARQEFDVQCPHAVEVDTSYFQKVSIPTIDHYKHLGSYVVVGGQLLPEIKVRKAQAMAHVTPLKHKFIANPKIHIQKRKHMLNALGISVLRVQIGTWPCLGIQEQVAWTGAVHGLYASLHTKGSGEVLHRTVWQLAADAGQPTPSAMLHLARWRVFLQLLRHDDGMVFSAIIHNYVVAGPKSWFHAFTMTCSWIQRQIRCALPFELEDLQDHRAWHRLSSQHPILKKLGRMAEKNHISRVQMAALFEDTGRQQREMFQELGCDEGEGVEPDRPEVQFSCPECSAVFWKPGALATHRQRKHGWRIIARFVAHDGACRPCGRFFHTRSRHIQHLQQSSHACLWALCRKGFRSLDEVKTLDLRDCAQGVANHQRGIRNRDAKRPCRPLHHGDVADFAEVQTQDWDKSWPTAEEQIAWGAKGLLPHVGQEISYSRRKEAEESVDPIDWMTIQEQRLRRAVPVGKQSYKPPRPLAEGRLYALIFFSGHRRVGDIAAHISWTSADIIPIPIDVAVDDHWGNARHQHLWYELARCRKVVAAHFAPPCETYSEARWLQVEGGPRPLRNAEFPWGDHL